MLQPSHFYTYTTLLKTSLSLFVDYFIRFVPNSVEFSITSCLSDEIVDGTVHRIRRSSSVDQHRTFNGHYQFHCITSILFIDFEGNISAVATNIDGSVVDSLALRNIDFFERVLNEKFAIGDPGCDYVVSGLKSNQVKTLG